MNRGSGSRRGGAASDRERELARPDLVAGEPAQSAAWGPPVASRMIGSEWRLSTRIPYQVATPVQGRMCLYGTGLQWPGADTLQLPTPAASLRRSARCLVATDRAQPARH